MIHYAAAEQPDPDVQLLRRGVPEAWKRIFFEYYPEALSFGSGLLRDVVQAQRVVLNAFFTLWSRRTDFDSIGKIKTFLFLTVRTSCLQELRSPDRAAAVSAMPEVIPSSLPA